MASGQIKRIEKILVQIADTSTIAQKKKVFQSVNRTLTRIINRIDKEVLELEQITIQQNKYDKVVADSKSEDYKIAKKQDLAKTKERNKQAREKLKETLITGYEVLMMIREKITQEEFIYDFMIQTGLNTFSSFQANLDYKDLLRMVNLEGVSSGKYELRFKDLRNFINNTDNIINYEYFVESSPSTAFSTFYRFFTDERLHAQYKLNNFGTFYEAYSHWYYANGNNKIPSNEQILQSFTYAKSGGGSSGAFYRGGDNITINNINISNKAQSLSASENAGRPGLTTLSAIKNGLIEVKQNLNIFIQTSQLTQIENTFSVKRIGEVVENGAKQTSEKILAKQLNNLDIK